MLDQKERIGKMIEDGKAVLGIELGSTRIKAVLIDENYNVIADGGFSWENRFENGIWTYDMEDVRTGLQTCYRNLRKNVADRYGVEIHSLSAIGISAMMHGYLAINSKSELLAPFRTWRNTNTEKESKELTELFHFNVPLRWSISHLYYSITHNEEHVKNISLITTLSGYVHLLLTGKRVIGVGDGSGMFPIDTATGYYNERMLDAFDRLVAEKGYPWKIRDILPEPLAAGSAAGELTPEGALLLDDSGQLMPGIPLCPPEGDAGTGMVATDAVSVRTGNVSAGTSVFGMIVLEKDLSQVYRDIDIVTTPAGDAVAMAHVNNCTSDSNDWISLFSECLETFGAKPDTGELFTKLYEKALEGDADCGGLVNYNCVSGEPVIGLEEGRPLFARTQNCSFTLANFMRAQLYSSLTPLKYGMDILLKDEKVALDEMKAHGGFFKTPLVGQKFLAAALGKPITVMETAAEGGAWGIALLADYLIHGAGKNLGEWLDESVFQGRKGETLTPVQEDIDGFNRFAELYEKGLAIEKTAVRDI